VILAALPDIVRQCPDVLLVFACRTKTPEALAIEEAVRRDVAAGGWSAHVRFLRQVADFESLLALSTLVLFPVQSLRRKMDIPLTLLQALALRRPLVVSALGPLTELIEQPVGTGVTPGDAAALAAAVVALLKDPERCGAMGAAGQALVAERYTMDRMASSYEQLYASLSGGARPA
jgi:glycosyltransferase involved in cell wall biosynthesis